MMTLFQFHMQEEDDIFSARIGTVPVGKIQLFPLQGHQLSFRCHMLTGSQYIFHFSAISACIHIGSAAGTSGNTPGKFQTGQVIVPGKNTGRSQ